MNYEKQAEALRVLADVNRLRILNILAEGEKTANEILSNLKIGQSTLSHHMKTLCEADLVKARKNGKWTCYTINGVALSGVIEALAAATGVRTVNEIKWEAGAAKAAPLPKAEPEKKAEPVKKAEPEKKAEPVRKPKKDDFVPWM